MPSAPGCARFCRCCRCSSDTCPMVARLSRSMTMSGSARRGPHTPAGSLRWALASSSHEPRMRTKWIWVHFPAVTDHRATPTEEAQPPPEHLLPKGQVLVVLLIGGGTVTRLQPALERIADHVVLSQMPLTVVHSPSTTAEVDQALVA